MLAIPAAVSLRTAPGERGDDERDEAPDDAAQE